MRWNHVVEGSSPSSGEFEKTLPARLAQLVERVTFKRYPLFSTGLC